MKSKAYRLPVILLAAFFIGIYLFGVVRPAGAVSGPWVRWKIDLTFPNDKPKTELIIQKWHTTTNGQHVLDAEKSFPIFCGGNLPIENGKAIFDGKSYYVCNVPSIQELVWQTWQLSIPDTCSSKRPYVMGQVTIEASPTDPNPENPIFYREDIQFNVPLDKATQQAALDMTFDQATAESGTFAINPAGHDFTAYIARSGPSFSPFFVVDGNSLSAIPAVITQSRILSNLESTIYFGYSPVSGEYFEGALGPIEVDPVCTGTG